MFSHLSKHDLGDLQTSGSADLIEDHLSAFQGGKNSPKTAEFNSPPGQKVSKVQMIRPSEQESAGSVHVCRRFSPLLLSEFPVNFTLRCKVTREKRFLI